LHVFLDQQHFEQDREAWNIRGEQGVRWQTLDRAALQKLEPDLDPRYTLGILVPETGSCRNPGEYLAALVAYAQGLGARLVSGQATGFKFDDFSCSALLGVQTDTGHIACTHAIIAAGSRAKRLAALAGDEVPLETERGYHAVLKSALAGPRVPTMFADCKVIVSSMDGGIRVAGQVEIASNDDTPNWRRAEILRQHLLKLYPKLPKDLAPDQIEIWMGRRPSTPDGIPCIGRASGCTNIIHAYGHGHIGLVSSAKTGRLVSQLLDNLAPDIDMRPFSPQRFKR
jgi:D-amino-acid dehydrogenase